MSDGAPSGQTVSIDSSQFRELTARMDAIIKILALTLPKELTQADKIRLLSDAGFQPRGIASILGTTANTVSVTLSKMKRASDQATKVASESGGNP